MNPVLLNGDLLVYHGVNQKTVSNGTLIIFFQGQSGLAALDYMVRPIVVHRVIGVITQSDGTVYYRTKGDNNQFDDPALVRYDQVLGAPSDDLPVVGTLVLFLKSPQGLITLIAIAVFLYLNRYENLRVSDGRRKEFLAIIARMALNGEMGMRQFEEFKLAVDYGEELPTRFLKNPVHASLADWIKTGGLSAEWREESAKCPTCLAEATIIRGKKDYLLICPRCSNDVEALATPSLPDELSSEPIVKQKWSDGVARGVMALTLALNRLTRRKARPREDSGLAPN